MDRHAIAQQRLSNQRLSGEPLSSPEDVVASFGAMQAQEYPYAKWGIGQRSRVTDEAVEGALRDGVIVRTHAMRPTWHFVAARDIRWLQELTGPRVHAVNRTMYARNALDESTLNRARDLIARALRDGNYLTRQEVSVVLRDGGIEASGQRLAYIMMHNELDAMICNGPRRGKQHSYALVAERAPQARSMGRDEALAELTRRYFAMHGPATIKDYVWWSGLLTRDARLGVELNGGDLERFELDGTTYFHDSAAPLVAERSPSVRLLQAYDEYVVGYTESRYVLNVDRLVTVPPSGQMIFWHAIVVDGQVAGYWRRTESNGSMRVEVQFARQYTHTEYTALEAEVARFGEFFGRRAEVSVVG